MNYEERISTRADVKALFERVHRDGSVAKYRGYTDKSSYGWDAEKGDYIRYNGIVWFENPGFSGARGEAEPTLPSDDAPATCACEREELCRVIDGLGAKLAAAERESIVLADERDGARELLFKLRDAFAVIRHWVLGEM